MADEIKLPGHKVFVTAAFSTRSVRMEAVTDSSPPFYMTFDLDPAEAIEIARMLTEAAEGLPRTPRIRLTRSGRSYWFCGPSGAIYDVVRATDGPTGGWEVRRSGSSEAIAHFTTLTEMRANFEEPANS